MNIATSPEYTGNARIAFNYVEVLNCKICNKFLKKITMAKQPQVVLPKMICTDCFIEMIHSKHL